MNRGVVVILDQLLADHDSVFEVVTAPWHERDQYVAPQRQFARFGTGTIGQHIAFADPLPLMDNRLLADAGVLVRALELCHLIDVCAHFPRHLTFVRAAFHTNNDAFAIHRIYNTGALTHHHRAGIACRDALHAGTNKRSFRAQQRNCLALHIRTH